MMIQERERERERERDTHSGRENISIHRGEGLRKRRTRTREHSGKPTRTRPCLDAHGRFACTPPTLKSVLVRTQRNTERGTWRPQLLEAAEKEEWAEVLRLAEAGADLECTDEVRGDRRVRP